MSEQSAEGLSFLLPVHNQAANLEHVLTQWSGLLEKIGRPYEIIVINDGSTDSTTKNLNGVDERPGIAARIPHVQILHHSERKGYGASIRGGLLLSQYPLVFYTGCDYPYNPVDLRKFLIRINDTDPETGTKIDVVNGYRAGTPVTGWHKDLGRIWRLIQRITLGMSGAPRLGWLGEKEHQFAFLVRLLFGLRIGDINSKFKLFRKKIFERIPIQSDGDFVHAEILSKANFLGCLMDELPIAEKPGPFPAHLEPAGPAKLSTEMRRVFFRPDFGPAVIVPKQPQAAIANAEMPLNAPENTAATI